VHPLCEHNWREQRRFREQERDEMSKEVKRKNVSDRQMRHGVNTVCHSTKAVFVTQRKWNLSRDQG